VYVCLGRRDLPLGQPSAICMLGFLLLVGVDGVTFIYHDFIPLVCKYGYPLFIPSTVAPKPLLERGVIAVNSGTSIEFPWGTRERPPRG